jgi:hypothetical protein
MFLDAEFGPAFLLFLLWTLIASVVLTVRPSVSPTPTRTNSAVPPFPTSESTTKGSTS